MGDHTTEQPDMSVLITLFGEYFGVNEFLEWVGMTRSAPLSAVGRRAKAFCDDCGIVYPEVTISNQVRGTQRPHSFIKRRYPQFVLEDAITRYIPKELECIDNEIEELKKEFAKQIEDLESTKSSLHKLLQHGKVSETEISMLKALCKSLLGGPLEKDVYQKLRMVSDDLKRKNTAFIKLEQKFQKNLLH